MRYLLVALLLAPLHLAPGKDLEPGSERSRWVIKTSLPANTDLTKPGVAIKLDDFLQLKPAAPALTKDYWSKLYAKVDGAPAGEGKIVRTVGYVRLVAEEDDGDFHIQMTTKPDNLDNCLVVEVPVADDKFVAKSAQVLGAAKQVRTFVVARLLGGVEPKPGSNHVMAGQAYVEVTGQLFFDAEHEAATEKGTYRGKAIKGQQLPSKTAWEIHPITAMRFVPRP